MSGNMDHAQRIFSGPCGRVLASDGTVIHTDQEELYSFLLESASVFDNSETSLHIYNPPSLFSSASAVTSIHRTSSLPTPTITVEPFLAKKEETIMPEIELQLSPQASPNLLVVHDEKSAIARDPFSFLDSMLLPSAHTPKATLATPQSIKMSPSVENIFALQASSPPTPRLHTSPIPTMILPHLASRPRLNSAPAPALLRAQLTAHAYRAKDTSRRASPSEATLPRCRNCSTCATSAWRRDEDGYLICNACGLFLRIHGVPRPVRLRRDVVAKRKRGPAVERQENSSQNASVDMAVTCNDLNERCFFDLMTFQIRK